MKIGDLVLIDSPMISPGYGEIGIVLESPFRMEDEGIRYIKVLVDTQIHMYPDYWLKELNDEIR